MPKQIELLASPERTMMCEFWGHPVTLPIVPETVGSCNICGGDIFDYEAVNCNCDRIIHQGCPLECLHCKKTGCKNCMVGDGEGNWFCPDECMAEYYEKENGK